MQPASSYINFVKASPSPTSTTETAQPKYYVSGEEAKRLYLEEVKDASKPNISPSNQISREKCIETKKPTREKVHLMLKDYFLAAQNNDIITLRQGLEEQPEMMNAIDEFGWSLLMIACQANSVQIVQELLNRGADTSIRDKAGNSARSLVIKNKNLQIANMLLDCKAKEFKTQTKVKEKPDHKKSKVKHNCETCGHTYPDKEQHLVSTVHNITASKGKKVPPCYKLPETNKGFQIMLKTGWDKGTGLGYDGSGIQYPLRAVQKKDRKGLGHEGGKTKVTESKEEIKLKQKSKKLLQKECRRNKNIEINFRREFY